SLLNFFSLYRSTNNPSQHAFPTRRSSDLNLHGRRVRAQQPPRMQIERVVHGARRMVVRNVERGEVVKVVLDLGARLDVEAGAARSEEHTSELQSREKLVCRLLLEKKKNNQ